MKKLFALGLCLLLLAGCAAPPAPSAPAPSAPVAVPAAPAESAAPLLAVERNGGFNPYETTSACNRLILSFVVEPLFSVAEKGEVTPILAEAWSVSDDGLITTVTLRKGLTLHNGEPVTAELVASCVEQAQKSAWYGGRFYALASVEAAEEYTLTFTTTKAYECFPRLLDLPVAVMVGEFPAGTGAYQFRELDALVPFEGYAGNYPTERKEIALTALSSQATLRDGFEYGGISAVHYDPNGVGAVRYSGDYELWGVPTTAMQYVGFNLNKGPFASEKLRSAVTYAIDRQAIVAEDLVGFAVPAAYAVRPGTVWDDTLTEKVEYNPEKLRDVAAGQSATMIVCGEYAQRVTTASRIARALNECGLSVTVKTLSAKDFRQALTNGNFDLYYAEAKLSPDYDLTPFFAKGGACAYGGLGGRKDMTQLCDLVLSNHGNAYDLQRAIQKQGLLCPVAFKTTALCLHRNIFPQVTTTVGSWIWE